MSKSSPIRHPSTCSRCDRPEPIVGPFCPECGRLSSGQVFPGGLAVELNEIPSAEIRAQVVRALRSWFQDIDSFAAERSLRSGSSVLVSGVNEASAERLLTALRACKAGGRIIPEVKEIGRDWKPWVLNAGLAATIPALLLAYLVGPGLFAFVMVLAGAAAPPAVELFRHTRRTPLVMIQPADWSEAAWEELSQEYTQIIERLPSEPAEMLRSLTDRIFSLFQRLVSGSLVAVAAGGPEGELYRRLFDLLQSAVRAAGAISGDDPDKSSGAGRELASMQQLVKEVADWMEEREGRGAARAEQLGEDLDRITGSIDRIVEDVRPQSGPRRRERERSSQ